MKPPTYDRVLKILLALLVFYLFALGITELCRMDNNSQATKDEAAARAKEDAFYWHHQHDPYRVFQYSATGAVIGEWVSDGQPVSDEIGDLYFNELGTGFRMQVGRPNHFEQSPGTKPAYLGGLKSDIPKAAK
jgi:hypothetical protein